MSAFHILNGDSLKSQLPSNTIVGDLIVARECLVDGEVAGETVDELIQSRIKSMHEMYGVSENEYVQKTVPEFKKIENINKGEVNLWFEDDLFCQVNFWFVCSILNKKSVSAFLVRPTRSLEYGFAAYLPEELSGLLEDKIQLTELHLEGFSKLWKAYQSNNQDSMIKQSHRLTNDFPFVYEAVQAHLQRFPLDNGVPEKVLTEIMNELNTQEFGSVFKEFSKRLPIYGFGDLQVKRIFDQLIDN